MKLSIVIPAYNEEENIEETVTTLFSTLQNENIPCEIIVINDNSSDGTLKILEKIEHDIKALKVITNPPPNNGFGYAIKKGLEHFSGDVVAIMMGDLSDAPEDLVKFYYKAKNEEYDCVFGNRWGKGGKVIDYPLHKKIANRIFNYGVAFFFGLKYRDLTNAFKMYKRETIDGLKPIMSPHFNLTLELPLKAIVRGYNYTVVPNSWRNRQTGMSKLKIKEMGSRYFFIFLYCLIEKFFSKGDFKKVT